MTDNSQSDKEQPTPRTDGVIDAFPNDWAASYAASLIALARQLERELAEAKRQLADMTRSRDRWAPDDGGQG